jgi:DegV family protein with EDD domain
MDETVAQRDAEQRARIALVTDSTCDLREVERSKYVTAVVPLHVTVGGISYLDRVDLDSERFYKLFRETGQLAQSSQPSVGEFANVYKSLLESYDQVVSIHISGRLSGAVNSASMAADAVDPARIRVVDSRKVSAGVGLVVQTAGEAIAAGLALDEVGGGGGGGGGPPPPPPRRPGCTAPSRRSKRR